jgi:hypothetical protein
MSDNTLFENKNISAWNTSTSSYKNMQRKLTGQIMPEEKDQTSEVSGEDATEVKVMTLNCWGLYVVSSLRNERMNAIGKFLAEDSNFDVVLLQEVWCKEDYILIQRYVHFIHGRRAGAGGVTPPPGEKS